MRTRPQVALLSALARRSAAAAVCARTASRTSAAQRQRGRAPRALRSAKSRALALPRGSIRERAVAATGVHPRAAVAEMEASALAPGPEAEDDEGQCTATFVAEADELHALVQRIRDTQGAADPGAYARVAAIVRERPPNCSPRHSVLCLPPASPPRCVCPVSAALHTPAGLATASRSLHVPPRSLRSLTPPACCFAVDQIPGAAAAAGPPPGAPGGWPHPRAA